MSTTMLRNGSQYQHMRTKLKHQRQLKRFPSVEDLKFAAIDILGPSLRNKTGRKFVLIITERYSMLTRAILTTKITSTEVENIFFHSCVMPYGIPDVILSDNRQDFVNRISTSLFTYRTVKELPTAAFHLQAYEKVEIYNKNFVSRLKLYIADSQRS